MMRRQRIYLLPLAHLKSAIGSDAKSFVLPRRMAMCRAKPASPWAGGALPMTRNGTERGKLSQIRKARGQSRLTCPPQAQLLLNWHQNEAREHNQLQFAQKNWQFF